MEHDIMNYYLLYQSMYYRNCHVIVFGKVDVHANSITDGRIVECTREHVSMEFDGKTPSGVPHIYTRNLDMRNQGRVLLVTGYFYGKRFKVEEVIDEAKC